MMKDAIKSWNDNPINTEQLETITDLLVADTNKVEQIYSSINFFARLLPPEQMNRILAK